MFITFNLSNECIQGDWLGWCGVDSHGSGYGPMSGSREHGDEPSGSGTTKLVG
jgi:hypothetical protein